MFLLYRSNWLSMGFQSSSGTQRQLDFGITRCILEMCVLYIAVVDKYVEREWDYLYFMLLKYWNIINKCFLEVYLSQTFMIKQHIIIYVCLICTKNKNYRLRFDASDYFLAGNSALCIVFTLRFLYGLNKQR